MDHLVGLLLLLLLLQPLLLRCGLVLSVRRQLLGRLLELAVGLLHLRRDQTSEVSSEENPNQRPSGAISRLPLALGQLAPAPTHPAAPPAFRGGR